MEAIEIKKNIYWVGAIDFERRDYYGCHIEKGTTYNAYLIIDEEVTLIGTVPKEFSEEMFCRISKVINPSTIKNVIVLSVREEVSGSILRVLKLAEKAVVISHESTKKRLEKIYDDKINYKFIKQDYKLKIGLNTLSIFKTGTSYVNDNIMVYLNDERILFSNNLFSQHYASTIRFDDEILDDVMMESLKRYYANRLMKNRQDIQKIMDKLDDTNLTMVAPSFGVVWRENVGKVLEKYREWCNNEVEKKAVIVYDTNTGCTKKMAHTLRGAFELKGYMVSVFCLKDTFNSDVLNELLTAEYLCVGSPTIYGNMLPSVSCFLTYLDGLSPRKRKGIVFGSYGGSPQAVNDIYNRLGEMGYDIENVFKVCFNISKENVEDIVNEILK